MSENISNNIIENFDLNCVQYVPINNYKIIDITYFNNLLDSDINNYEFVVYAPKTIDIDLNNFTLSGYFPFVIDGTITINIKHKLSDLVIKLIINYKVLPLLTINDSISVKFVEGINEFSDLNISIAQNEKYTLKFKDDVSNNYLFIQDNKLYAKFVDVNNVLNENISGECIICVETEYNDLNGNKYAREILVKYNIYPWITFNQIIDTTFNFLLNSEVFILNLNFKTFDDNDIDVSFNPADKEFIDLYYNNYVVSRKTT